MLTGVLISGISSAVFSLVLLILALMIRRRYAKLLPYYLQQAADTVIDNLKDIKTGGIDRVPAISAIFKNLNYEPLQRRWNQCLRDFTEIGNSRTFFDVEEVFRIEPVMDETLERTAAQGAERLVQVGGILSFCSITAIGFLLDNAAAQGMQGVFTVFGMAFTVLAFSFLISIIYHVYDGRSAQAAYDSYTAMLSRLKECLPPIGRNNLIQTLFLMQAEQSRSLQEQTLQMKETLENYAKTTLSDTIGTRFDDAISTYLAPPIQKMADTQDALLHRLLVDQHKRLDQLFTLFTTQVGGLLSQQLEGMAGSVSGAAKGMLDITSALQSVSEAVSVTLSQNRETTSQNSALLGELSATHGRLVERFSEATILLDDILTSSKILADTTTNANLSTIELSEMAVRLHKESGEKYELLNKQQKDMAELLSQQQKDMVELLSQQQKDMAEQQVQRQKEMTDNSTQLLDALKTEAERLVQSLHQEGAGLLQVLPTQMKEAFDSFTASMGETMRSTLTDSVDIIDKLGQKTEQLHSEFAMYFSRTEGNTNKLVDDLRFAMEGAIGKFAEMSNDSLNQLRDGNMEAMTAFAEQTRLLMEAVDEQTRTISLYIKDMGIDMGDLNKGLKSSVSEFSNQLQMGVEYTFKEFDTGLAEIVQRMTELGTSIEEAVQALPETIGRLNQGTRP